MSDTPDAVTDTATEIEVVRSFLQALGRLDIDAALEMTDPGIEYQNVPLPPARGRAAFERQMRVFERRFTGFEARLHAIAANGGTVLTERTDVIEVGRVRADFWVCGTFEVRAGRIVLWRDYFDYVDVTVAFARGAVRALAAALRGSARGGRGGLRSA
jgi:limonene-1,2-epoxide hydrolase